MTVATESLSASRECTTSSSIVPIRVDALSEDKTIRIVDTLLFDPTCWPISLYQPLHASVEENVVHIAHTILSDAEVQVRLLLFVCLRNIPFGRFLCSLAQPFRLSFASIK